MFQRECQVAGLFDAGCCGNLVPCNVQRRLEPALQGVRCLGGLPIAGALSPAMLIQQVQVLGRPVCAHITWRGGGPQHFVARRRGMVDPLPLRTPLDAAQFESVITAWVVGYPPEDIRPPEVSVDGPR